MLTGAEAESALSVADRIAEGIAATSTGEHDPSLAGGQAGLGLLYGWRAAIHHRPADRQRARHCLDTAVSMLERVPLDASLWGGFPGVAWAVEMVEGWLEDQPADRNADIDDVVAQMLGRPRLWALPHDLVTGVTGTALYLLERHPRRPAGHSLRLAVERLGESACSDDAGGVFWWTPVEELDDPELQAEYPSGYADLGAAHGLAGTVALLGRICAAEVADGHARPMLDGAVRWLRRHAVTEDGDGPAGAGLTYPLWVAPGVELGPARSAWCYGDPGIAAALLLAARAAGEPEWEQHALALARRAAARPEAETGVVDGGFCHGAAGLAHVYNRLYQATGEAVFAATARRWLGRTLDFCSEAERSGPGWVAGREDGGPWVGLDIVDGAAGVALVLLAAATGTEPVWDRMFLLS